DCTGDNAGDSVGPSADGFETYGVTGVALISFILLAVFEPAVQVQLLVWIFSLASVALTFVVSYVLIPQLGDGNLWWQLSCIISCGTLAGAIIPELIKVFTSTESAHVGEVVT